MPPDKIYTTKKPVDAELLFFIQSEINDGSEYEKIFDRLSRAGWDVVDINEAFAAHEDGEVAELPMLKIWFRKILSGLWYLIVAAFIIWMILLYIEKQNNPHGSSDARIKATLTSIRNQAELIYNNNSYSYAAVCGSIDVMQNESAKSLIEAAKENIPKNFLSEQESAVVCNSEMDTYAVSSRLSAKVPRYWCVDSTGYSGLVSRHLYSRETVCSKDIQKPNN